MKLLPMTACALLLTTLAFSAAASAAESSQHLPHNHLALLIGHAEEEQKDGHHESGSMLGVEYLRQFHQHWGVGAAFEAEAFGDNQKRHGILAFPVSYFPNHHWRLFAAPGMEFSDNWKADKAMFRLGMGYEFRLGARVTLSPEAQVDFVEGGTTVIVLGLALGIGF